MTDLDRNQVVWAPAPFKSGDTARPWLIVASDRLPYPNEESIAVAFTTQSQHSGSLTVPSDAWVDGEPDRQSHALPWTISTIKDEADIVATQGRVTDEFRRRVVESLCSYLDVTPRV